MLNTLPPERTALLVMDYQKDVLALAGDRAGPALPLAARVVAAARARGIPIFYVVVGFRPGYPELDARNAGFATLKATGRMVDVTPADLTPEVGFSDGDILVTKHRVSAFAGSDLEMLLRVRSTETLILFGIATSGVVLSTVRQAADLDFKLVVVSDCCVDGDDEVHRVLTQKVFPRQATVVTAGELAAQS